MTIEVFIDVVSAWCYVGTRRLAAALGVLGGSVAAEVRWLPLRLDPGVPPEGVDPRADRVARYGGAGRAEAVDALLAEAARAEGLALNFERVARVPNTLDAHRLIALAGREGVQDAVVEALFRAYFTEGRDLCRRATLLDTVADAGLDRARAAALLTGTGGTAEVWAAEARGRHLGARVLPFLTFNGTVALSWAWDPPTIADAIRRASGAWSPAPPEAPPAPASERYGFRRTRCGCDFCRAYCRHVPGRLDVADPARLCPEGADVFAWAEHHLRAVVGQDYPKLVPSRAANGHCHWYGPDGCAVHADAPYGCAYFDAHMDPREVQRRSLAATQAAREDAASGGLYSRLWRHLIDRGLTTPSGDRPALEEELGLLQLSVERGG